MGDARGGHEGRRRSKPSDQSALGSVASCTDAMGIPDTPASRKALKVAELRECLAEAGLETTGTKPVLLDRLEEVRFIQTEAE